MEAEAFQAVISAGHRRGCQWEEPHGEETVGKDGEGHGEGRKMDELQTQ